MNDLLRWSVSILVFLLVGGAATLYFLKVVSRRDEAEAGIVALTAMSWRSFIHAVLDALKLRGYTRVFDREAPSGDDDYTLERDGRRWLLSCKHGSAFVLGIGVVNDLANKIRLGGAAGGLLVTQGRIAEDVRNPAALQKIELLDGPTLWPELRELIPAAQLADIRAVAKQKARQRTLLSWLLALVVGVACFLVLPAAPDRGNDAGAGMDAPASAAGAGADARSPAGTKPIATTSGATIAAPADGDGAALDKQRKDVAAEISTLPVVERAVWATSSTLQVYVRDPNANTMDQICPLLERYDALAPSRVQLTPPAGSNLPTRFRQCRSY